MRDDMCCRVGQGSNDDKRTWDKIVRVACASEQIRVDVLYQQ